VDISDGDAMEERRGVMFAEPGRDDPSDDMGGVMAMCGLNSKAGADGTPARSMVISLSKALILSSMDFT
jgi:hypothetical protein